MDEFVRNKLTEWGLSDLIDHFKDEGIHENNLYDLDDQDIKDLISKVGPRATFKKILRKIKSQQEPEEAAGSDEVLPSTSAKRQRQSDLQGESSEGQQPKKPRDSETQRKREAFIRSDVKKIMRSVHKKLPNQGNAKLNELLRNKIDSLEIDKRELIGVFGRTGAGKSSLINAVTGEKNLLPTGKIIACTSVMIKVESNPNNSEYQADIEFIAPEDWKEEVLRIWENKQKNDDYREFVEKKTAVYGEEWKEKTPKYPISSRYFSEIPEFLRSEKKTLKGESAEALSEKLVKYTRTSSEHDQGEGQEIQRWFWPLVKCVTVKVPDNHLLQHVTLVDLPGTGDRNKSRDEMWKGIVGRCSTVWIVANIERPVAEKEPWEILENTCSLMGNGGQCQRIHFICTKSDVIGGSGKRSDGVRDYILQTNKKVKEKVKKEFDTLDEVKKHFSDGCFKVFTVSSDEFLEKQHLDPEDTEIPELQEFLKDLNVDHSETFNYVSGARGILSLMHGANSTEGAEKKADVCAELEKNLEHQLGQVQEAVEAAHRTFETRLTEGVEKSKDACKKAMNYFLDSEHGGVYMTLKSVVEKDGVHKTKKGELINLNAMLASCLTDNIDKEFRKTFPNEDKSGSFKGAIRSFSLDTQRLTEENKSLELLLIFLKMEEDNIKTELYDLIRDHKKTIYNSLKDTVKENMLACYQRAAGFRGDGAVENIRGTLANYVQNPENMMFEATKNEMLDQMNELKEEILKKLKDTLQKSIEISLKTDVNSIPDVPAELEKVKKYYNELKRSSKEFFQPNF